MSRIVVSLSVVLMSATVTVTFTACDVGSVVQSSTGTDGGNNGTDSSGSGSGSSALCEEISATPPDGHHNEGQSCIAAGCHLTGQTGLNAPPYTYAGTLYTTAAGTTTLPGATIFVKLGATEKKVITATNGNFWMGPSPAGLDSPTNAATALTKASGCAAAPMAIPMVGALVQGGGNCNNCHRNGGTTTPIHLP